jgi:hypothetical protein
MAPLLPSESTDPFSELSAPPPNLLEDQQLLKSVLPSIDKDDIPADDDNEWEDEGLDDMDEDDNDQAVAPNFSSIEHSRYHARTYERKLGRILEALRKERWGLRDLLTSCVRDTDTYGQEIRLELRGHTTGKARRRWVAQALNAPELQGLLLNPVDVFCEELKALRTSSAPYFRKFDLTDDDKLRELDFSEAFALIRQVAPQWHKTQLALLSNERSHRASWVQPKDPKKSTDRVDM